MPVNHYLNLKISAQSKNLFRAREDRPQLEVLSLRRPHDQTGRWCLQAPAVINTWDDLQKTREDGKDACAQIYIIRQSRSWAPLVISSELFQHLMDFHDVFPHFWKCTMTFGHKINSNEFSFPSFRAAVSHSEASKYTELAYVIRRVERLERRPLLESHIWSIRQTGVYHKITYPHEKALSPNSDFILIAPSKDAEEEISQYTSMDASMNNPGIQSMFWVHERLISNGLMGWMDFMTWLEEDSQQKRNRLLVSDNPVSMTNENRQDLEMVESQISELLVILQTMIEIIGRVKKSCLQHCQLSCSGDCACEHLIEEFDEHTAEAQMHLERAKILQIRVQSTERFLSDLLVPILIQLTNESRNEGKMITELTLHTAQDSIGVKVLTIIGLLYLPTTIVLSFFSTQLIHVDDRGNLHISRQVWIVVVAAVGLTILTLFLWRLFIYYEYSKRDSILFRNRKQSSVFDKLLKPFMQNKKQGGE